MSRLPIHKIEGSGDADLSDHVFRLEKLTRREFREARQAGRFGAAILATGSVEQHLEHLAMEQDIASSTYVAESVAERLYPNVAVAVPMAIGISEHHMKHPGTLTAKPGSWLAVLFDAIESMVRVGVTNVLVLNGHGGNVQPVESSMRQWKLYFKNTAAATGEPKVDLRFHSYWDLVPKEVAEEVLATGQYPGHAGEFETSITMEVNPGNVRNGPRLEQEEPGLADSTAEKGRVLIDTAIDGVTGVLEEMLAGR